METKVIKEILESHEEFRKKIKKQMDLIRQGKPPSREALVKEKEETLARFKARLEAATRAKEEAVRRYDEEIRGHKEMLARLEKEIREDKKALERPATEAAKQKKEKTKSKISGRTRAEK